MPKAAVDTKVEKVVKPKAEKAPKEPKEVKPKAEKVAKPKAEKVVKEKKEKPAKKPKDPHAPKRGLGSYMMFCKENRDTVKQGVTGGAPDIARALGAAWKELTDAEKVPYEDMAAKDKARYLKEMASYTKSDAAPAAAPKAKAAPKAAAPKAAVEEEDEEDEEEVEEEDE